MRNSRTIGTILILAIATSLAMAQTWQKAYETGLRELKAGKYREARTAFMEAVALRPEDSSNPTVLPGSATDRRVWRNGAPYSANFAAAYAGIKQANSGEGMSADMLPTCAAELEALLAKGQYSPEAFYFLNKIYAEMRNVEAQQKLDAQYKVAAGKMTWKIDPDILTPEEKGAIAALTKPVQGPTTIKVGGGGTSAVPTVGPGGVAGDVAPIASKYAFLVGNSDTKIPGSAMPFAATDVMRLREALVQDAGYPADNVIVDQNATSQQILASARALADKIDKDATVFFYFSGAGVNLDGKDYLAGVECESPSDSSTMVAKSELLKPFIAKGARVFCFYQVNRPIVGGRYFGSEVPMVGMVSQVQSTLPGGEVYSIVKNGESIGLFTDGMVNVIRGYRNNRIPILDFGWDVYYFMRKGGTGVNAGGSPQTPTLPVLTNMASDARF